MALPPDPHPSCAAAALLVSRRVVRPLGADDGILADRRDLGGIVQASTYTPQEVMQTFARQIENKSKPCLRAMQLRIDRCKFASNFREIALMIEGSSLVVRKASWGSRARRTMANGTRRRARLGMTLLVILGAVATTASSSATEDPSCVAVRAGSDPSRLPLSWRTAFEALIASTTREGPPGAARADRWCCRSRPEELRES